MRYLFIGGDMRMVYAAKRIGRLYETDTLGLEENETPSGKYGVIVLPLPLTKDGEHIYSPLSSEPVSLEIIKEYADKNAVVYSGGYSSRLWEICRELDLFCDNYYSRETLTLKNAVLTSEAAAGMLIQNSPGSLLGSKTLIIGYGRIGKSLSSLLKSFGSCVTVAARNPLCRTLAELNGISAIPMGEIIVELSDFDYVINTAPVQIFTEKHFAGMKEEGIFMELASISSQPSEALCEKHNLKYIFAGGLPGKYSPKTAGEFIAEEIMKNCGGKAPVPRKDSD